MDQQTVDTRDTTAVCGRALMVGGAVAALLGIFAWGWDVDPTVGKALLALGAVSTLAGWWVSRREVSRAVSFVLLAVAVALVVVVAFETVQLIEMFNEQRGGRLA